mgnify:CR=1 FL=1
MTDSHLRQISVRGAKEHNLKNVSVDLPRDQLVVITGLSGSGKSSLAFDTIYAEGQRRYVESLSAYARQFLEMMQKPDVDLIEGLSPAISIEQKTTSRNPRSTVGTVTEIYDYMRLLWARIGIPYSPTTGLPIRSQTVSQMVDILMALEDGTRLYLLAPIIRGRKGEYRKEIAELHRKGFSRVRIDGELYDVEDTPPLDKQKKHDIEVVVDRLVITGDADELAVRLADSLETALGLTDGLAFADYADRDERIVFSARFACPESGFTIDEIEPRLFSFNNPFGACDKCDGYGDIIGIDPELVIPNTELSIYEDCIAPWKGEKLKKYKQLLVKNAHNFDFPIHRPYYKLSKAQKELVWEGNEHFKGINFFFKKLEEKMYKIQNRVMLSRYRGRTSCSSCKGKRLRKEASYVKINGVSITDLVDMPISKVLNFFKEIKLDKVSKGKSERLLIEIVSRLEFITKVGLEYLTLNRKSNTLSGGETQRINLATSLGSSLVGSIYVLDEPSVGLHPEDTKKLIEILVNLKNLGNTVIVVEHDEDIINAADHIIDLGPGAGSMGGTIVGQGNLNKIVKTESLTAKYLTGEMEIPVPESRKKIINKIILTGCRENNLKNISVDFPLEMLVCITGISGSGKTTLVKKILYPALQRLKGNFKEKPGQFSEVKGDIDLIGSIEYIDQNPIGMSSRSNPATYLKVYDDIRNLFAVQNTSKQFSFKPKHFSFNVDGGRCDSCKGEGTIKIEMQFMSDIVLPCETCKGKRFKKDVLKVKFQNKNIDDILNMTIEDASNFFIEHNQKRIATKLKALLDVGMGYVKLGQSSSTLSGGEAQRIKLASFLLKGNNKENTLFIFDEPTTGLHFHDIKKLIKSFNLLIEFGHSIIVVEHNIDLIKSADHIIDLGPYGGEKGGDIVYTGTVENLVKTKKSLLSSHLKSKLR